MTDLTEQQAAAIRAARQAAAIADARSRAAPPAQERSLGHALVDNIVGLDDGYTSFGEDVGSFINRFNESATVGIIGDEAAAMGDALMGGNYQEALADRRAREADYADRNPALALTADIGGAFAPGLGVANAAGRGMTLGSRMLRGLGLGAAGGATFGAMESEQQGLNRLNDAVGPAALGGLVGAVMPGVGQLAQRAYRAVGPGVARQARAAQRTLGLDRTGAEIVSDAVQRDAPFAAERLNRAGPDALVGQMGPNTGGLLDYVANRVGPGSAPVRDGVESFAAVQGTNLVRTMDDVLGVPQGVNRAQRQIMQHSAPARREAYSAAYSAPINYASERGQQLLNDLNRVPARAINMASELMRTEGAENLQRYVRIADDGTVSFTTPPDVQTLDYITRALNDMTDPLTRDAGPTQRNAYRDLARDLRAAVDDLVPEYRAARAEGRDAIANRNAVEFGSRLMSSGMTMDLAEDTLDAMTDGEKLFARQGVRSYFDEIMANAQRAMTDPNMDIREAMRPVREITNRAGERKLVALLGDDAAGQMLDAANRAYEALSLRSTIATGSKTAPRQMVEDRLQAANPISASEALQEGQGVTAAAMRAIQNINGNPAAARLAQNDGIVEDVGRTLMARASDPVTMPALRQMPGLLEAMNARAATADQRSMQMLGLLGQFGAGQMARQ